jgi:hypothetical protein
MPSEIKKYQGPIIDDLVKKSNHTDVVTAQQI